jgi:HEAT repeat protein
MPTHCRKNWDRLMDCATRRLLLTLAWLGSLAASAAPTEAIPLNDHTRLGQRFTANRAVSSIAVTVPSWLDAEGGLTLTLWDSPERSRQFARRVFVTIQDNAPAELVLPKPLPPGTYYWEVSERTGETRVGLYANPLPEPSEDCAYLDGVPDPTRRFLFRVGAAAFPFADMAELTAALGTDRSLWERTEACRQLAVMGDRKTIPLLARLLADEDITHMARFALEPMPHPEVDRVFRDALGTLRGAPLAGVVNSLGVRRDPKAVKPLRKLLAADSTEVATAAAIALGRIGTPDAAEALTEGMEQAADSLRPCLHEALLECAAQMTERGRTRQARAVYDQLRGVPTTATIQLAALRGAIVTRGAEGVPLLLDQLRGTDPVLAATALWVAQHDLPGAEVSAALASALPGLPPENQLRLAGILGARLDSAALAAVMDLASGTGNADRGLRLTALRSLPRARAQATAVAPVLLASLTDPDDEIAGAATDALRELPVGVADAELTAMLGTTQGRSRLQVIQLLGARRVSSAVSTLLQATTDPDPAVRAAALRVLGDLAGPEYIPSLLDRLAGAVTAEDREAAEKALRGALGRASVPEPWAERLAAALPTSQPDLKLSLLRLLHGLGGDTAFAAVREATADPAAEITSAAYRLLGEWKTPAAAAALLALAAATPTPAEQLLCLRGGIRLAGSKELSPEQRQVLCQQAAPLITRDDEKKLLLGVLGGMPTAAALAVAMPYLGEPAIRAEAVTAILAVAEPLARGADAPKAVAALEQIVRVVPDSEQGRRAEALLAAIRVAAEPKQP